MDDNLPSSSAEAVPPAHLICPICLRPFTDPVALPAPCAHEFCRRCIAAWLPTNATCPLDRNPVPPAPRDGLAVAAAAVSDGEVAARFQLLPCEARAAEAAAIPWRCQFPGCVWIGTWGTHEGSHATDCVWRPMACPFADSAGCVFVGPSAAMTGHIAEASLHHTQLIALRLTATQHENVSLRQTVGELLRVVEGLRDDVRRCQEANRACDASIAAAEVRHRTDVRLLLDSHLQRSGDWRAPGAGGGGRHPRSSSQLDAIEVTSPGPSMLEGGPSSSSMAAWSWWSWSSAAMPFPSAIRLSHSGGGVGGGAVVDEARHEGGCGWRSVIGATALWPAAASCGPWHQQSSTRRRSSAPLEASSPAAAPIGGGVHVFDVEILMPASLTMSASLDPRAHHDAVVPPTSTFRAEAILVGVTALRSASLMAAHIGGLPQTVALQGNGHIWAESQAVPPVPEAAFAPGDRVSVWLFQEAASVATPQQLEASPGGAFTHVGFGKNGVLIATAPFAAGGVSGAVFAAASLLQHGAGVRLLPPRPPPPAP